MLAFKLLETFPRCVDRESVVRALFGASHEWYGADFSDLQLYSEQTQTLEIVEHRGLSPATLASWRVLPLSAGTVCARAAIARKPIVVHDVEQDRAFAPHLNAARAIGVRFVHSVPIVIDDELFGVVSFLRKSSPQSKDYDQAAWTINFCAQLAGDRLNELAS